MTYARQTLVCLQSTPYYHVVARCVRRAWLWGVDPYAGKDYSHRKAWVLERLALLDRVFAIDVCAYAVMSNHYHLVLHVEVARARGWTEAEVIKRWQQLFRLPGLVERYRRGQCTALAEEEAARALIGTWRARLGDLSWYLRALNEHLARRANREDGCTGRFWEGRFKSQALLDEAGLLTALAYVDLNPVRAGIARTPETSPFTSIAERIRAPQPSTLTERSSDRPLRLLPFRDAEKSAAAGLPFTLTDYLTLLDWTGRAIRQDRRGHIDQSLPPILTRLHIEALAWRETMRPHGNVFGRALGQLDHLRLHARALGQAWIRGLRHCERLYGPA